MENPDTQTKLKHLKNKFVAATKTCGIVFAALILNVGAGCAQAPTLSYSSPQTYTQTVAITPLAPISNGVAAPAYSNNALTLLTGLEAPTGVTLDSLGHVFVVSNDSSKIFRVPVGGGAKVEIASGFKGPVTIASDAAGNVFVTEYANDDVKEIPVSGGTPFVIGSRIVEPSGIAVDAAGNIFVINEYKRDVIEIPTGGGPMITLSYTFMSPIGLAIDAMGDLYVADQQNPGIIKIPSGGGTPVTIGSGLSGPIGVAVDASGNVFALDGGSVKMFPSGGSSFTTLSESFSVPGGVAVDASDNLYVSDRSGSPPLHGVLKKIAPVGGYFIRPALPAGLLFNTTTGTISGTPTVTSPATNYTVTAFNSSGSTSATVNIRVLAASHNANLSRLQLSRGTLSPGFSSATTSYTTTVDRNVTSITVTPTTTDATATVKVNGTAVTSGMPSAAIPLAIGLNTITTIVTAQDGTTTKTYTVAVNRPGSTNANLSALHLSAGGLTPSFSTATTSYTAKVGNSTTSITVTPTTSDTGATVKINGTSVASGTPSAPIELNTGPNTITVVVTAQDGATKKTYTITETRALSSNANLATLGQSLTGLTPSFTPGNTSYTINTGNATTSMTLKPVSSDANATIKVNGTTVASGTKTAPIALAVGPNTITTIVKAQDGTTTKTYTLTITRASGGADSYVEIATGSGIGVTTPTETPRLVDDGIMVHQGVSPNGDGINDFLMIENISQYPDNKLVIMNRNGQLVFETKGYDNSSKVFDGHSNKNGQMQLPGTYFYQLEYTIKGILKHKTGFIVLKY